MRPTLPPDPRIDPNCPGSGGCPEPEPEEKRLPKLPTPPPPGPGPEPPQPPNDEPLRRRAYVDMLNDTLDELIDEETLEIIREASAEVEQRAREDEWHRRQMSLPLG